MVNEIPVSLFEFMLGIQFFLLMYAIIIKSKEPDAERIDTILTGALSVSLGWLNANMILNGNVTELKNDGTFRTIQSLPIHYFLLSIAIISAILAIWLVIDYLRIKADNDQILTALGGDSFG